MPRKEIRITNASNIISFADFIKQRQEKALLLRRALLLTPLETQPLSSADMQTLFFKYSLRSFTIILAFQPMCVCFAITSLTIVLSTLLIDNGFFKGCGF